MGLSKRYPGWRLTGLILSISSAIISIAVFAVLATYSRSFRFFGERVLYQGSCHKSSQISLCIQLGINVTSSIVLASSNFFMQIIAAPTRKTIDAAHKQCLFLDIGIPSCRNLFHIPKVNAVLWLLLGISSVPLHLLFNSSVLEIKTSTDSIVLLASESFLSGNSTYTAPGIVNPTTINSTAEGQLETTLASISQSLQNDQSQWQHINLKECLQRYNNSEYPLVNYRHMIMVISDPRQNLTSGWTVMDDHIVNSANWPNSKENTLWTSIYLKRGQPVQQDNIAENDLSSIIHLGKDTNLLLSSSVFLGDQSTSLQVGFCVSELYPGDCRLELQIIILTIVCGICMVKSFVAVMWMAKSRNHKPLLTVGDAIESFITVPDDSTVGLCTYGRKEFIAMNGRYWRGFASNFARQRKHNARKRALGSSMSALLWFYYCVVILTLFTESLVVLLSNPHPDFKISNFGQSFLNPAITNNNINTLTAACISNLPQLILSIGYMVYNSIFTYLLLEREWSSYGMNSKTLRVTEKRGEQRSTHRLQLPYRYSIPLIAMGVLLHWLFSNCIYIAIYNGRSGFLPYESKPDYGFKGLQISPVSLLITLITISLMAISPILLACVPRSSAIALGGSCSAVISAACHCITPGQVYVSPAIVQGGGVSPLKPDSLLLYSKPSLFIRDPVIGQDRAAETNDDDRPLAAESDSQRDNNVQEGLQGQENLRSESNKADQDHEDSGLLGSTKQQTTEDFLERMTLGKLTWGVVWNKSLEGTRQSENTGQFQYHWVGSVLVPGAPPESPQVTLAHFAFGTVEQVTRFWNQEYEFA
ncbi:hypothetical protein F4777DRAFT_562275 [Nemania sp. FL0916]|nr:hypothetical protein F4777DRAFT_562275 [Nemania sp. FL0916]